MQSSSGGGCSIGIKSGPLVGALTGGAGPATATAKVFVKISEPATVKIDLSADPCFSAYSTSAGVAATTASDTAVIVPLTGLANRQIYYYRVVINDCRLLTDCWPEDDPSSSFMTSPTDEVTGVNNSDTYAFAFLSCSMNLVDQPTTGSPVFQALDGLLTNVATDDDPAIVFQIGDWDHRNPGMIDPAVSDATCNQTGQPPCNTSDWRAMHMDSRGPERLGVNQAGTEFKTLVQKHFPIEHIWDNHDFAGLDHFSGPSQNQTLDNIADAGFLGRPNVLSAYLEYWPMHTLPNPPSCVSNTSCTGGVYRTFTYGNVDFFILDLRFQRSPTPPARAAQCLGPFSLHG